MSRANVKYEASCLDTKKGRPVTGRPLHEDSNDRLEELLCDGCDIVCRHAEFLHDGAAEGGDAEAVDADGLAGEADILAPGVGNTGFNRDTCGAAARKHALNVVGGLAVKALEAGQRNHAHTLAELLGGAECVLHFRTGCQEDELELAGFLLGDVAALEGPCATVCGSADAVVGGNLDV